MGAVVWALSPDPLWGLSPVTQMGTIVLIRGLGKRAFAPETRAEDCQLNGLMRYMIEDDIWAFPATSG